MIKLLFQSFYVPSLSTIGLLQRSKLYVHHFELLVAWMSRSYWVLIFILFLCSCAFWSHLANLLCRSATSGQIYLEIMNSEASCLHYFCWCTSICLWRPLIILSTTCSQNSAFQPTPSWSCVDSWCATTKIYLYLFDGSIVLLLPLVVLTQNSHCDTVYDLLLIGRTRQSIHILKKLFLAESLCLCRGSESTIILAAHIIWLYLIQIWIGD